jgi:hypothetical protein
MTQETSGESSLVNYDAVIASRIGFITIKHQPDSEASPVTSQHALYDFQSMIRAFAGSDGVIDVRIVADFLAGGEVVPESDIQILNNDVRQLALWSEDMRDIGEGLFAVLPELKMKPDPKEELPAKKTTGNVNMRTLDEMMYKELGPPRWYLPKNKRARQKALNQISKAKRK